MIEITKILRYRSNLCEAGKNARIDQIFLLRDSKGINSPALCGITKSAVPMALAFCNNSTTSNVIGMVDFII